MNRLRSLRLIAGGVTLSACALIAFPYAREVFAMPVLIPNSPAVPSLPESNPVAQLVIPKLSIQAPVIQDVSPIDSLAYNTALQSGVALASGSADVTASTGNSFIFGHSSRALLSSSPYDHIFANLPNMQVGDNIQVLANNTVSTYVVTKSISTSAKDVSYYAQSQNRQITLVTCWPIGTNIKRWVVQAEASATP
jgi:LPXTG-site transpeptidase (sortase) family protein